MKRINENIQAFTAISALCLLFQSFCNGLMLLASHGINFRNEAQLKLIIEIFIFAISSIIYFRNIEKLNRFNFQVFVIIIPVIISVYDQIVELGSEFELPIPIFIQVIFIFYFIIIGINILLLTSQLFFLFKK